MMMNALVNLQYTDAYSNINMYTVKTLAELMRDSSFCGLGQSVGIPMLSALTHFGAEFARAENEHEPIIRG